MKKLLLVLGVVLAYGTTAMAIDIAISSQAGWMGQAHANTEVQEIVNNVTGAAVQVFTASDHAALATWVADHTGNGQSDLLIMFGQFPATIYAPGNTQPNGSLAEEFLDDGNCIINTGDYIFYVVNGAGTNAAGGLQNMMDVPAAGMWGDDTFATKFTPTADGALYTPSLVELPANRPWIVSQFAGTDWKFELILAQTSNGAQAHPAILRNSVTGGRVGVFFQCSQNSDSQLRGEVISEWINNWYLKVVSSPRLASNPVPEDGAVDIPRDAAVSWKSGDYAVTHDVYFGTSFDDVNDASATDPRGVLVSPGQADAAYDPDGLLEFGQTYYWRTDEVNGAPDNTVFKGVTWSFTVEPFAYPVTAAITATASSAQPGMGAENTVNGSGLDDLDQHSSEATEMWMSAGTKPNWIQFELDKVYKLDSMLVWNSNQLIEGFLGFGAKNVTIEYSADGATWTVLEGVPEFARAPGAPGYAANTTVDMAGVMAKYVKLTINANHGGMAAQTGLSEVRFFYVPVQAFYPQPADGATDISVETALDWRPGREATSHVVSIGTDSAAVADGTVAGETVADHGYTPAGLLLDTEYFWKVDSVGAAGAYAGDVWSFTTEAYAVVEDFESYNDDVDAETTIWHTWIDGLTDGKSGSQVGYDVSPFAEKTIIHGGRQAMPLKYSNVGFAFSEATRTFDSPQDWTARGIKGLALYFYGATDNGGQLYVKINNTKIVYNGPAVNIRRPAWQLWSIDLAAAGNVGSVRSLTIGIEGAGASGILYVDDIRLHPEVLTVVTSPDVTGPGDTVQGVPNDGDWPAAEYPALAIDDSATTKYLHRKGGSMSTGFRVAPLAGSTIVTELTFTTANDVPTRDPIRYELSGSNTSIDGPYTAISSGDIVDFAGATNWPRFTKNTTPIKFSNTASYKFYQVVFPKLRGATETLMQIAEVEFIGKVAP